MALSSSRSGIERSTHGRSLRPEKPAIDEPASRRFAAPRALLALVAGAVVVAGSLAPRSVLAAEPAECLLQDPAKWPAPAKPYFMIAFDTSGSMATAINPLSNNSCGYPNTRTGHGTCAVKNTVMAYSGQANFGLASYARKMTGCSGGCYAGCSYADLPNNSGTCASGGCGPEPNPVAGSPTRAGANILVPMLDDTTVPPPASNVAQLLSWVDNSCAGATELFGDGCTPLNGILRDMYRYYAVGWTYPGGGVTYPSPLTSVANGERACRSVNVILVTDGDENCDNQADAVTAAQALYAGFSKDGLAWSVKTYVINFAGGSQLNTDAIAAGGGTTASYFATNETQLALALSNIIGGSIKPETCDNVDNNCNGCTDEGFTHYCNVPSAVASCCAASSAQQRSACLTKYQASITPALPQGNLALLPCTTPAQQQAPAVWLCYDPGEKCDGVDNNCASGADEGITKCGSPLHCPNAETCNGQDDNCDGLIDEGGVCPNSCAPSAEVCDGCDNDCDGVTDNGIDAIPCGLPASPTVPANCAGTITCKPSQSVPVGTCAPGGGFNACNNAPQVETCDGKDEDCDGLIDNGIAAIDCVPAGAPSGLDYGPTSACKKGQTSCLNGATSCNGFVGPSAEICDGIDNDCDGQVDEGVPGVGIACGVNQLPCTAGLTVCDNGALVCHGDQKAQPEICNGIDDNCNGVIDEAPLADAPAQGQNGCWTLPGTCCTFANLAWCPPPGAGCTDNGALSPPCNKGSLACSGAAGWVCQNPKTPGAETCDGVDNDCNGAVDDGPLPQVNDVCGLSKGECKTGTLVCKAGLLDCLNDVPPSPELCDGKDNDCDGKIDNGISTGGSCDADYDHALFPGDRSFWPCQKGMLQCNGLGGSTCVDGVGPSPEVCDGVDNDCDGKIDEAGPGSGIGVDSVDGTANPLPPAANLGDACGKNSGACVQGAYACVNGLFTCVGAQMAVPETCDCVDNDCDGVTDNPNGPGGPPLCGAGKDCVKATGGSCQCAQPCAAGEFKCPAGQKCDQVTSSQTGQSLPGGYCVTDPAAVCGDCALKAVKDANEKVICAPAGTTLPGCITPPVCTCKGQGGCQDPCTGVTCGAGTVCTRFGLMAGTCVVDTCWNVPCQGCGKVCSNGACVDGPTGAGGSASATSTTGTTGATSTSGSSGVGGAGDAGAANSARGIFGLATGGGGCSCEVGPRPGGDTAGLAALAAAIVATRRRRRSPSPRRAKEVA